MSGDGRVDLKRMAGEAALSHVESGMKLGLGSGSTSEAFIRALGVRVAEGLQVVGVPTSERAAVLAASLSIPLATLDEVPELNLTIDGADEIGPDLALIKGGGGALLREKIVATASRRMIVIADSSKVVDTLGAFPLPIEVVPFGLTATRAKIAATAERLGLIGTLNLRKTDSGAPYLTDGGHFILDASFRRIPRPEALAKALEAIPGVVEHGLFIGIATMAIVAHPQGIKTITR
ncbi:MAG: ribose-5-phosphate isomerase RpiA [Ancalomicrobiaceae bacterium]|nr:ribose-5-phosphate isomerase RpiA [Ancalomicrobiaceae bacterium]